MEFLRKFYFSPPVARCAALLWMGLVFYTSTKPSLKVEGINQSFLDHLLDFAHFPVYFVMAVFLILSFNSRGWRSCVAAFVVATLFGILNEFLQLSVPGRSFSIKDMFMNGGGALLAAALFIWTTRNQVK